MKIIFGAILTLRAMIFGFIYAVYIRIYIYISANNHGFLVTKITWTIPLGNWEPRPSAPPVVTKRPVTWRLFRPSLYLEFFKLDMLKVFFQVKEADFAATKHPRSNKMHETWDIISWRLILKLFIVWLHKRLKHAIPRPSDSTLLFVKWKNNHSSTVSNAAWQHITFCVTLTSVANMSHVFAAVAPTGFPAVHFLLSRAGPFVKFGHPCTGDIKWCYHDNFNLVGGWTNPFETYDRQIGNLPQIGVNITNIWNHHLATINQLPPNVKPLLQFFHFLFRRANWAEPGRKRVTS